jgi:hypothetical protein
MHRDIALKVEYPFLGRCKGSLQEYEAIEQIRETPGPQLVSHAFIIRSLSAGGHTAGLPAHITHKFHVKIWNATGQRSRAVSFADRPTVYASK